MRWGVVAGGGVEGGVGEVGGDELPVGHAGLVQGHEVDLTRGATFRRGEEHLKRIKIT